MSTYKTVQEGVAAESEVITAVICRHYSHDERRNWPDEVCKY